MQAMTWKVPCQGIFSISRRDSLRLLLRVVNRTRRQVSDCIAATGAIRDSAKYPAARQAK